MSIFFIIKLCTFIIFAVCSADNTVVDAASETCVCAADYYQTSDDGADQPLQCAKLAHLEAQQEGNTNPQGIAQCGKNARIIIPIDWHQSFISTEIITSYPFSISL